MPAAQGASFNAQLVQSLRAFFAALKLLHLVRPTSSRPLFLLVQNNPHHMLAVSVPAQPLCRMQQ
jgi:hypothetical protein